MDSSKLSNAFGSKNSIFIIVNFCSTNLRYLFTYRKTHCIIVPTLTGITINNKIVSFNNNGSIDMCIGSDACPFVPYTGLI